MSGIRTIWVCSCVFIRCDVQEVHVCLDDLLHFLQLCRGILQDLTCTLYLEMLGVGAALSCHLLCNGCLLSCSVGVTLVELLKGGGHSLHCLLERLDDTQLL